jgi:DNA-binding FrmR family transcriptional regulator
MTTTDTPKKYASRTFRPWPATHFIIQQAETVGFNVSELINEVVSKHLRAHIQRKAAKNLRAARSIKSSKLTKSRN